VEFCGDLEVGGLVGLGTAQDEAGAEGEALGGEARVGDLVEAVPFVVGQGEAACFAGHEGASWVSGIPERNDSQKGSHTRRDVQEGICTRMSTLNPETCGTLA
jgi:hypothetical protein